MHQHHLTMANEMRVQNINQKQQASTNNINHPNVHEMQANQCHWERAHLRAHPCACSTRARVCTHKHTSSSPQLDHDLKKTRKARTFPRKKAGHPCVTYPQRSCVQCVQRNTLSSQPLDCMFYRSSSWMKPTNSLVMCSPMPALHHCTNIRYHRFWWPSPKPNGVMIFSSWSTWMLKSHTHAHTSATPLGTTGIRSKR